MTVLLVEDNPTNALVLRRLVLKTCDDDVDVVDNGTDALAQVHRRFYRLLVVDNMLKGAMSGLQLIQAVRMIDRFATLPILMVTSDQDMALRQEADGLGVHTVLYKPIDTFAFKEAARACLVANPAERQVSHASARSD
ncbi:response regulator [Rhizobium sp. AQ_MP]|uniref:response regulator n=1 Tax=Rhizobium sp. AQ_MP TaxID=2761536 RepID=UPI001639BD05|nr:response regulator [Rhizobium sp. AQ_MP]MBC2775858.1 response regulator [Rhizobium sp. AQ_MP]